MTRALVTQMLEGLESGLAYVENEANQLTTREYKAAITAAREYLATDPSGERAEFIARQRGVQENGINAEMRELAKATADMLEADAQPATPDIKDLQANGKGPAPCARFCEANAFQIEIRRLTAEINAQQAKRVPMTWQEADAAYGKSQDHYDLVRAVENHHEIYAPK